MDLINWLIVELDNSLWIFQSTYGSLEGVENSIWMYVHNTFWKEDLLNLTNFVAVYLTQFLTDFSRILESKYYDQA